MKTFIILFFAVTVVYTQQNEHFRVYAETKSDMLYVKILEEANLLDVFAEKYQMVVNTKDREPFLVIGAFDSPDAELDPEAFRYDWTFFSKPVREGILKIRNKKPVQH